MMRPRVPIRPLCLALCAATATACFTYRVDAPNVTPVEAPGTRGRETVWSFLWGNLNQIPTVDCKDQPLAEVTVRDNLGFTLLTILTLGLASPKQVEWSCAAPRPLEAEIPPTQPGAR